MKIASQTARCPSCKEKIYVGDHPKRGSFLVCKFCEEELEIVGINPVVLDWRYNPGPLFETSDDDQPKLD